MMTTLRPFEPADLYRFNNVNIDPYTETYGLTFYLQYMINWPEYFQVAVHPNVMGKTEGKEQNWHGHVTALTVALEFRRMKLAAKFMEILEQISERKCCYFVDLFVRVRNEAAISLYKTLEYYAADPLTGEPDENAYDMRKALSKDIHRKSVIPLKNPVSCLSIELLD